MAIVSETFAAVGTSAILTVAPGQSITYSATSFVFTGVAYFERSDSFGSAWDVVASATNSSIAQSAYRNDTTHSLWFRFRVAESIVSAVSGALACEIADAVDTVYEFKNSAGDVVLAITDEGIETPVVASPTITSLSTGLSTTDSTVSSLSTGLSTTDGGLLSLSTGLSTADSGITSLSTGLSTTTSSVTSLSTVVSGISGASPYSIVFSAIGVSTPATGSPGWVNPTSFGNFLQLPASSTAAVAFMPISGLKVGDTITKIRVFGRFQSAGNTASLSVELNETDIFTSFIGGNTIASIPSVSSTTNTVMAGSVVESAAISHLITSNMYTVGFTGTTAASTLIQITGVELDITPA